MSLLIPLSNSNLEFYIDFLQMPESPFLFRFKVTLSLSDSSADAAVLRSVVSVVRA